MTQQKTVRIEQFLGINNKDPRNVLATQDRDVISTYLQEAVNVDILRRGKFTRRAGTTLVKSGATHSLWADPTGQFCFVVENGDLSILDTTYNTSALFSVGDRAVAYTRANHEIYMSDNRAMFTYNTSDSTYQQLSQLGSFERDRFILDMSEEETFYDNPPPGIALAFGFGRLLVLNDEGLWFSQPGFPRRFNTEEDFVPFNDPTILGVVDDGIYLGDGEVVYFMAGRNIKRQNFNTVVYSRAVKRTLLQVDAKQFGLDGVQGAAVVWESDEGKIIGFNGGRVEKLTEDKVSYATSDVGASLLREANGETHHISTFPSRGNEANNFRTTDIAVAQVRRNGVILSD